MPTKHNMQLLNILLTFQIFGCLAHYYFSAIYKVMEPKVIFKVHTYVMDYLYRPFIGRSMSIITQAMSG